ncbi:hypothetical protein [Candidatus Nitrososphaera sp. FF02]|uniref:hypothetical protein n=1 Tax=Candidatus Nitrososphaera sp. FF02 TaxID=3398226 RepID=UPI0039EA0CA7
MRCLLANAIGGATVVVAGLAPVLGITAMVLATASFVVSYRQKSYAISGMLAAAGAALFIPALMATDYLAALVIPGPILGVIFGLYVMGLGAAKGAMSARRMQTVAAR